MPPFAGHVLLRNAGILLGLGLGGAVDGVVRRHEPGSETAWEADFFSPAALPGADLAAPVGVPAAVVVALALAGAVCLAAALWTGQRVSPRRFAGLLMLGWGAFRVIGGAIAHHLHEAHQIGAVIGVGG